MIKWRIHKIRSKIKKIKDSMFWRYRYCDECGMWISSSNNSPCLYCDKGDLAIQNFEDEKKWFNSYYRKRYIEGNTIRGIHG